MTGTTFWKSILPLPLVFFFLLHSFCQQFTLRLWLFNLFFVLYFCSRRTAAAAAGTPGRNRGRETGQEPSFDTEGESSKVEGEGLSGVFRLSDPKGIGDAESVFHCSQEEMPPRGRPTLASQKG
ncbi:hypothetical protein LINGRAHAP2_LOCUS28179 [Linum grandiflorum]